MTTARAPPSRERVVGPDRAAGFAERAPTIRCASPVPPSPPRRVRRRPSACPACLCCCSLRHRASSTRANTTPRGHRRAVSESSSSIAPPAAPSVRCSCAAPRACCRSRRAECADAPLRAQLAAAPCVTAPAQREPTRRLRERRRAESESSLPVTPPTLPIARGPHRRISTDLTALSFCCSPRHRPSSVIVREPALATPSERRAASVPALSKCRAS